MNLLFIVEDGINTTFYLYLLTAQKKKLIRFSPEVLFEDKESLAQKFTTVPFEEFVQIFEKLTQLNIENFVIAEKEKIISFLFKNNQEIVISNPEAFIYKKTGEMFQKGKISVKEKELTKFVSYQMDENGSFGIFERQEHILRLIKNELLRDKSLTAIPKKFNDLNKSVTTNMKVTGLLKFFKAYRDTDKNKTQRLTIPEVENGIGKNEFSWSQQQIRNFLEK